MSLQDRFQEDPVHMAMIISRNLKEEQKILATVKSSEVKPAAQNFSSLDKKQKNRISSINYIKSTLFFASNLLYI